MIPASYIEGYDICNPPPAPSGCEESQTAGYQEVAAKTTGTTDPCYDPNAAAATVCSPTIECGGVATVQAKCLANPSCAAFNYDTATKCGVLKTNGDVYVYKEGQEVHKMV